MLRTAWLSPLVVVAVLTLVCPDRAAAQAVVVYSSPAPCYSPPPVYAPAPAVSYYAAPAVSYYAPPAVSYYAPPAVSYYAPPAVSYYAAPAVSYYAAPSAVTTTRYGLFGRPRYSVTRYYP